VPHPKTATSWRRIPRSDWAARSSLRLLRGRRVSGGYRHHRSTTSWRPFQGSYLFWESLRAAGIHVRTLLLAAELQGRSIDVNEVDDPRPIDLLDEADRSGRCSGGGARHGSAGFRQCARRRTAARAVTRASRVGAMLQDAGLPQGVTAAELVELIREHRTRRRRACTERDPRWRRGRSLCPRRPLVGR
jgi:hypothetical protein